MNGEEFKKTDGIEIFVIPFRFFDTPLIILFLTPGDIGGVLGLFLGASLFTILEFFQFVAFSIAKYCCNLGKPKHSPINGEKEPI